MVVMEACWKVEQCVLCGSLTVNISICLPDFRSFLYWLVCSSNVFNHYALHNSIQINMSSTQHNPLQELCTSPTNVTADQLQPCSVDTKIPRQQWWWCLQIQPASPHWCLAVSKQKEIIIIKGWTVCRMCRDFPVPVLLQTLDVMTVMWCHTIWSKSMPLCSRCDCFQWRTGQHTIMQHNSTICTTN